MACQFIDERNWQAATETIVLKILVMMGLATLWQLCATQAWLDFFKVSHLDPFSLPLDLDPVLVHNGHIHFPVPYPSRTREGDLNPAC